MKLLFNLSKHNLLFVLCFVITLLMSINQARATDVVKDGAINTEVSRPAEDKARDTDRKPAEMLEFAQVKPGQLVIDYIPGKGYFTRIFSAAVGTQGAVYAVMPQFLIDKFKGRSLPPSVSVEPGHTNVHDAISNGVQMNVPVKVDLVWTSQNYHDVHIAGGADATAQLNKAVFDALKPGGLYVVLDHAGAAGLDDASIAKLHRIDRALVVKEVTAAGFILDGESMALRNPADSHSVAVFDPSIRGKTDQFILRFRKPLDMASHTTAPMTGS
ncbi:class I SAM-dependent methyltransferase [Solimicrobium silvestre]|uniref:Putative methyltransferase n=1 Tax=Solimicrobium silvestre TaxID=2099400 RepID=A0A2S9GZM8_9BURK|nr:class I SAM-dependent methyltransferase [Solimicrobium silvestre]PRC93184.1 putative methyltransferase [Solimicrobium silvestre]